MYIENLRTKLKAELHEFILAVFYNNIRNVKVYFIL